MDTSFATGCGSSEIVVSSSSTGVVVVVVVEEELRKSDHRGHLEGYREASPDSMRHVFAPILIW